MSVMRRFIARAAVTFAVLASGALPNDVLAATQEQKAARAPISDWQSLQNLPTPFQGRWGQMHLETHDRLVSDPKRCKHEDADSADLVLGSDWFLNGSGQGYLMNIEFSPNEQTVRLSVAYNDDGRVRLGLELFTLSADGTRLEVASQPEMGWEVMNYSRC